MDAASMQAPLLDVGGSSSSTSRVAVEDAGQAVQTSSTHKDRSLLCNVAVGLADCVAWSVLIVFVMYVPDSIFWPFLLVSMVAWRLFRWRTQSVVQALDASPLPIVPYTCGVVVADGRELFLVATLHISPRAPVDVKAVIDITSPDLTMIELDEERLDRMRDRPSAEPQKVVQESALQPVQLIDSSGTQEVLAQRALWNGEMAGQTISGNVVYDASNLYGALPAGPSVRGKIMLMQRGGGEGKEPITFGMKAQNAAKGGATAVLVINSEDAALPVARIGVGPLASELKMFLKTWNCGFPPVPVMLLPRDEGILLQRSCEQANASSSAPTAEMVVLADDYPRRTLRRRLCQACALMLSGIGILYGIIQCMAVEVGAEFTEADKVARARGIPCACIDVNLDRFWGRIGMTLLPTPLNVFNACWAWLSFPRHMFNLVYPPRGNLDVIGSSVLHLASLSLKTWVAFLVAGCCASQVSSRVIALFCLSAEGAGEEVGAVSSEDRDAVQTYILMALELYLLPQCYEAVAASRDEAMYQSIVAQAAKYQARRLVVVVGAAHSNGILERVRERGL